MQYYKLTVDNVKKRVPKNAPGAYLLGEERNKEFYVKYTGRSDTRLRGRLKDWAKKGKYSHFAYFVTETILEAYNIECREWHNAIELDNEIHPKKPKELEYKCPYCKIENGGFKEWQRKSRK